MHHHQILDERKLGSHVVAVFGFDDQMRNLGRFRLSHVVQESSKFVTEEGRGVSLPAPI